MKNLVLVGFMGSGKSVVGRRVAQRLGLRFLDMDTEIEERERRMISDIFAKDGEPRFRAIERNLVQELAQQQNLVISTGGGVVLDPRNLENFRKSGVIVALGVGVETVLQRVGHQSHRPLLEGGDKRESVQKLLAQREPLYRAAGKYIETDNLTLDQITSAVIMVYQGETP